MASTVLTRRFNAVKGKDVRKQKDGTKQGCGNDRHLLFGATGSGQNEYRYRSLLEFDHNWTDVKRVVKIELVFKTEDDSSHFSFGSKPRVRVHRLAEEFTSGSNSENNWSSGDYDWPSIDDAAVEQDLPLSPTTGNPVDGAWVFVDITKVAKPLVPDWVLMPDGSHGGDKTNHGFLLRAPGDETNHAQRGVGFSDKASNSGDRPYILLTYDPKNRPPTAPSLTGPATTNNSFADQFTGVHNDPEGDAMGSRVIQIRKKGTTTPVWTLPASLQSAGSDESQSGIFSVPLSTAAEFVKLQTVYEWRAATRDNLGAPATDSGLAYSGWREIKVTSSAPTVVATPLGTVETLAGAVFGATYTDPESNPMDLFRIQMQPGSGASWTDLSPLVWDTGETHPTVGEQASGRITRPYAGNAITPGTYTYRVQARDSTGVWSAWAQTTFTLSGAFDPDPGSIDNLTIFGRKAPVRVHLWKMGTNRGRGTEIGTIDDPVDLGASGYMNSGGEVYFTLPALHPYCPSVEPHQTHYAVEQYYGDRYRELFAGVITDFDADGDTMVAYGTDYLGLLQTAVDERYDPNKPELAASGTGGGSKYNSQRISDIINNQLLYHRALADSPVKFIGMGTIDILPERATIYSTYTECLPFVAGLMDSHKQGTGREARLYVKPLPTPGSYQFVLKDNWGKNRPNIRLQYGGLVNDFRVVALGDFGTRVLGVGQKRGEVKVYRAKGTGGLPENVWGRTAKTRFYQDITDQADLQRRVNEDAAQLAKVGKRIAIAIPANMLAPFDGYDIGDSIVVDIDRGVVDTIGDGTTSDSGYGSGGWWTILGLEWRYHPDAHDELTLTLLPKKTVTAPDPDLIPSRNPGVGIDWQVGYGVPSVYGELPGPTPPAAGALSASTTDGGGPSVSLLSTTPPSDFTAIAKQWQDLNTGCVYQLDDFVADDGTPSPTFGEYTLAYCPDTGGGSAPPDTLAPAAPTVTAVSSRLTPDVDGRLVVALTVNVAHPTTNTDGSALEDLLGTSVQITSDNDGNPDPSAAIPDWTNPTSLPIIGPAEDHDELTAVAGNTQFWVRAQAVDIWGNAGPWSVVVTAVTLKDTDAPAVPTGLGSVPGFRSVGLTWDAAAAPDFAFDEVRFAPDNGTGTAPDTTADTWASPLRVKTNTVVITDLDAGTPGDPTAVPPTSALPATKYWFQIRAVDFSGNVATSNTDSTAVDYLSNPEAGWSDMVDETPTLIGVEDLALNTLLTNMLRSGIIDASYIQGGTLKVSPTGGAAGIEVWSGTQRVGYWDATGLYIGTTAAGLPADLSASDYAKMSDGGLTVYRNGQPVVAVTPDGINADAINFGALPGGQNLIRNSSFELAPFTLTTPIPKDWNVAADWTATQQSNTNTTNGAGALTTTGTAY